MADQKVNQGVFLPVRKQLFLISVVTENLQNDLSLSSTVSRDRNIDYLV